MTQVDWRLTGDYFEACNCDIPCPCIFGSDATQGFCDVAAAWHVTSGKFGDVVLDGVNAVMVVHTPGTMNAGDWTVGFFVDAAATEAQKQAMQTILSGAAGGRFERIKSITKEFLGVKPVPMTFAMEGKSRSLEIPGILDMKVAAVRALAPDGEVQIHNVRGSLAPGHALTVAQSSENSLEYRGLRWDNKGKTSYYASFEYTS